jgi:hypothetical protein
MKRYIFRISIKHYNDAFIFSVVSTSVEEAIKRGRVVYRKIKYTSDAEVTSVERGEVVYV